jgi:hypothetical protein
MLKAAVPSDAGREPGEDDRRALVHQRQRLLNGEDHTFHVSPENLVDMLFGDLAERQHRATSGIGVQHVDAPRLVPDLLVQAIEIGGIRSNSPGCRSHCHRFPLPPPSERIEPAACDEDMRSFGREKLGRGEANAAGATCDDGNLAIEPIRHGHSPWDKGWNRCIGSAS